MKKRTQKIFSWLLLLSIPCVSSYGHTKNDEPSRKETNGQKADKKEALEKLKKEVNDMVATPRPLIMDEEYRESERKINSLQKDNEKKKKALEENNENFRKSLYGLTEDIIGKFNESCLESEGMCDDTEVRWQMGDLSTKRLFNYSDAKSKQIKINLLTIKKLRETQEKYVEERKNDRALLTRWINNIEKFDSNGVTYGVYRESIEELKNSDSLDDKSSGDIGQMKSLISQLQVASGCTVTSKQLGEVDYFLSNFGISIADKKHITQKIELLRKQQIVVNQKIEECSKEGVEIPEEVLKKNSEEYIQYLDAVDNLYKKTEKILLEGIKSHGDYNDEFLSTKTLSGLIDLYNELKKQKEASNDRIVTDGHQNYINDVLSRGEEEVNRDNNTSTVE